MKTKLKFAAIVVILVALIFGASVLYDNLREDMPQNILATTPTEQTYPTEQNTEPAATQPSVSSESTEPERHMAPDFTVYDLEGEPHKLSDYYGKPIVLNFWASWCGPCKSEMPAFQSVYEQYSEEVNFLIVNMTDGYRETVELASGYIEENGYTFPVFYDTDFSASLAYDVTSLPTSLFIDEDGYMVAYAMTAMPEDILLQGIEMILPQE